MHKGRVTLGDEPSDKIDGSKRQYKAEVRHNDGNETFTDLCKLTCSAAWPKDDVRDVVQKHWTERGTLTGAQEAVEEAFKARP